MTAEEVTLRSLFSKSKIMAGSKRVSIGQDGKTPQEMVQILVHSPAVMSATLHELAHFHTLTNPLGSVLTARALISGHFLAEAFYRAEHGGKDVELSLLKYIDSTFQLERLIEAYEPLLEGIAVYFQTSPPCKDIDELALPLQTLNEFGVILSMLDPPQQARQTLDYNKISQGILDAAYDVLKKGANFPFDESGSNLASALEIVPDEETLPYFLGHAYVRGIQNRVSQVLAEYECPEFFFDLFRRLIWARRAWPKQYDYTEPVWVDLVYGWNHLFRKASNQRIVVMRDLPYDTDFLEWLLDENIDEESEPVQNIDSKHFVNFLRTRLPDWDFLVKGETDMIEALPNIELLTHTMNLSNGGACRLVGQVQPKDHGTYYLLRVVDGIWWAFVEPGTISKLGMAPSDIPTISDGKEPPIGGNELIMSSYVTDGELGLGKSEFPGRPRHFLFWICKKNDPGAGVLLTARSERSLRRAVLNQVQNQDICAVFSRLRDFHSLLEVKTQLPVLADILSQSLGWDGLRESIQENQRKQDVALKGIRALWTEGILVDLLGQRGRGLATKIVENRMGDVLVDRPTVRHVLMGSYGGPVQLTGPGVDSIMALVEAMNERSVTLLGHPAFSVYPESVVRYMGLWGGTLT